MGLAAAQSGLGERRVMKQFAEVHLPEFVKQLQEIVGFALAVDVNWESLHHQGSDSSYWIENMKKVYFEPTVAAFKAVCADDMGREAVKAKIKKLLIQNSDGRYNNFCSIDSNTLVFDHGPDTNVDYGNDRTKELTSFLESSL